MYEVCDENHGMISNKTLANIVVLSATCDFIGIISITIMKQKVDLLTPDSTL